MEVFKQQNLHFPMILCVSNQLVRKRSFLFCSFLNRITIDERLEKLKQKYQNFKPTNHAPTSNHDTVEYADYSTQKLVDQLGKCAIHLKDRFQKHARLGWILLRIK